jgi:hypothetical protein
MRVLLFLWELPLNLWACFLLAVLQVSGKTGRLLSGRNRVWDTCPISVSLGLSSSGLPAELQPADRIKEIEYGTPACNQRLLGLAVLIIVGLPSFSGALYFLWYESRFHEHWDAFSTASRRIGRSVGKIR